MSEPFFTIGHSIRTVEEFIALLQEAHVQMLIDVRSAPSSRRWPQFNAAVLAQSLADHQIGYVHIAALGGHRKIQKQIPDYVNALWTNRSFHNYADYAMTAEFRAGLTRLREIGHAKRSAIMCAEALWWHCHRRIIADYLLAAGEDVQHSSPTPDQAGQPYSRRAVPRWRCRVRWRTIRNARGQCSAHLAPPSPPMRGPQDLAPLEPINVKALLWQGVERPGLGAGVAVRPLRLSFPARFLA